MIVVREARPEDMDEIHSMANKLLMFLKLPYTVIDKETFLIQSGFFPPNTTPFYHVFVAEETLDDGTKTVVGYSLDYFMYKTTSKGHTLFIEDLYVDESVRGKKVGHALMKQSAIRAKQNGCLLMRLECFNWNEHARKFYESHGGISDGNRVRSDAITYTFDRNVIDNIVKGS